MSGADERNDTPLVVVLSAGSRFEKIRLSKLNEGKIHLLNVSSGYEAAAEIFTKPVAVLIIDLSHQIDRYDRLLEIASRRKVPVVAFGTITGVLNGAILKDVHLVGMEQIKQIVEKILSERSDTAQMSRTDAATESIETSVKKDD